MALVPSQSTSLSWATTALKYSRETFLLIQLLGVLFFALTIPIAAVLAERGRRVTLIWVSVGIFLFGLVMAVATVFHQHQGQAY